MGRRWRGSARPVVAMVLACSLSACALTGRGQHPMGRASVPEAPAVEPSALGPRPIVGAHYYHWYPGNWGAGTLRAQLDPAQEPELGHYDSKDPEVAEQHIAWASEHGIDVFTLDWWPVRHQENQAGIAAFLEAENIADIDFTIFYETWDLAFDPALGYADLDRPGVRQAFVEDMAELADRYFDHPSYLRIDGRPVVVMYLTRVLVGDLAGAMAEVRAMWRERGHDPFVIADDIFWRVTVDARPPAFTDQPQASRIRLFDAITAYNPYESSETSHAGHGAASRFLPDVLGLYQRFRDATGGAVPVVPNVLPGYNDRGVRPSLDHYVIPRVWAPGAPEGSFLAELLRQLADPSFDERAPFVFVTSWNEWNEDTGIEPVRPASATSADTATDGISRTDGHPYEGFGPTYLEVLRDHYVAVAGSAPPGVLVSAWRDGEVVAQDTSDSNGRFTLSRAQVGTGPVTVVADRHGREIVPDPRRTILVDL